MSLQAEIAFIILIQLYIELDQRSGWVTHQQFIAFMKSKKGVAEGRSENSLQDLKTIQMLEFRNNDGAEQLKISSYGVQWVEKTCPMSQREPEYEFAVPILRSIKLVGPDEFFGRSKTKAAGANIKKDWPKWGAIAAVVAIPIPFIIWWLT